MNAHTQAHTHAPTLAHAMSMLALADAAANPGMRTMRRTLAGTEACSALGLRPRDADTRKPAAPPKPAKAPRVSAPKPAPKGADAPDEPETLRAFRVVVLVAVGEGAKAHTHVSVDVDAAGPRRASRQARAQALAQGHTPVGVCAVLTDDCPKAVWDAAKLG